MANLTEHVIINKWDNDINEAITAVGGNTEGAGGLPDYASIIREQLVARGVTPTPEMGKEFILEGDSCVIEADATGCDPYNTEYAVGIKSGLIPGTLYLRLCTAVKDIEPVYIDLTRVSGSDVDIEAIIDEVLKRIDIGENIKETIQEVTNQVDVIQNNVTTLQSQVTDLQDSKVDNVTYLDNLETLNTTIETKVDKQEVEIIVNDVFEERKGEDSGINVDELIWD